MLFNYYLLTKVKMVTVQNNIDMRRIRQRLEICMIEGHRDSVYDMCICAKLVSQQKHDLPHILLGKGSALAVFVLYKMFDWMSVVF